MSLRPLPGGVRGSRVRATLRPTERTARWCCCVLLRAAACGAATADAGVASEDKELATLYGVVRGARHARVAGGAAESQVATRKATRAAGKEGHEGHEKHEGLTAVW